MQRTTILLTAALALAAAAGCSDDAASPTSLAPLSSTPASTTTVITTASTVEPADTGATTPPTTAPASTTSTAVAPASSTSSSAPTGLYVQVAGPELPEQTMAIDPAWIEANGETLAGIADGQYWGTPVGTGTSAEQFVDLKLVQAFFGDACIAKFGTGDDACNNDYGLLDPPTGSFPAYVDAQYVTVVDEATKQNYLVDGPELFNLVNRGVASPSAPQDYFFVAFPFLVTVSNGVVISLEQVWVP